jgi:CRP/FNR family cyclic AMP-dependent transcriptional regulator
MRKVDPDVSSAVSMSNLRGLPGEVLDELMRGTVRTKIPAGSLMHREGETARHLYLVVSGVVRVFVTSPDGRMMTVRYCRPGGLIGAMSLFATQFAMPGTTQALLDAELLKMSPEVVRRLGEVDVRVARAFLRELSERAWSFIHEIPGSTFATVRQRVARRLLDLASDQGADQGTRELIVPVTQQELADAVGTVREVIVRVLRELRQEGVVRTERDRMVIIDPARLIDEQGWNPSS